MIATSRAIYSSLWLTLALGTVAAEGRWPYRDSNSPPVVARHGSNASVVLDCNYNLSQGDVLFHVKWFHLRSPQSQVYQWIYGHQPQALGRLKGSVNLGHRVSEDGEQAFRALEITTPTVDLSGLYECKATSAKDNIFIRRRLIVYAAPTVMSLFFTSAARDAVNVTCYMEAVYPEPQVTLYRGTNSRTLVPVEGFQKHVLWQEGFFDVTVSWLMSEQLLLTQTMFECVMEIPETHFQERRHLIYEPGATNSLPPAGAVSGKGRRSPSSAGPSSRSVLLLLASIAAVDWQ